MHAFAGSCWVAVVSGREIIDLYDRHACDLLGYLARRTRDPQLALDLLGETFLVACEQRRRCRARDDGGRAAWLYRIAASRLADHYRQRGSERRALERLGGELRALSAHEVDAIEQLAQSSEMHDRVSVAFARLSGEQREAVHLHVIEERPYAEVSARLGVSEQAVRARVSRGLRALRRASDRPGEETR